MYRLFIVFVFIFSVFSCKENVSIEENKKASIPLFTLVSPDDSNVTFKNILFQTNAFNFLNYSYIFNGGGVAIADINNDGLEDIYFTSNQGSNKLYLNKGNFEFVDITNQAGIADYEGWTNGVSAIDINNDGFLDFYICKSASLTNPIERRNKLFVNQGDNTFTEESTNYGLDHPGFSTQSYFLDYDRDGDLDVYLVNHRPDFRNTGKFPNEDQKIYDISSDQLFRNDGNRFTKVTQEAGILNKAWGLSASIGDFNNDGWTDIYVANDFLEPDFLYINNKNGTFSNEIHQRMNHITFNSMGSDFADINNDSYPDLIVLDMSASDHVRSKENMATMSTSNFNSMVKKGYHYQYMVNTLQLNNSNGDFSEVGQLAGVAKTDWSWAPLIADFNNDGLKDIFVTNGIEKDLGNQDFRRMLYDMDKAGQQIHLDSLLVKMPGTKISNYAFQNNDDLNFTNATDKWGLNEKVNSNGVAYADLDNDGDLDLVINNQNDIASIYKNNTINKSINIKLIGNSNNKLALGTKLLLTTSEGQQYQEKYLSRGYLSSVSQMVNFGLGDSKPIKLEVIWPDNKRSVLTSFQTDKLIEIFQKDAMTSQEIISKVEPKVFQSLNAKDYGLNYIHNENEYNDYDIQLLLPQKQSTLGPCMSVADVNGDGLDDVFIGGSHKQSAVLYIQGDDGSFSLKNSTLWSQEQDFEDVGSHFFDADGDGDMDLYVASGGYEFPSNSRLYQDRLYINNGAGVFTKTNQLPKIVSSTKAVKSFDFDKDGDLDLIVGGRVVPGKYPTTPESYILENNKGIFIDITDKIAPNLRNLGMISDIEIADISNNGIEDIIVVGPWMPITVYAYNEGVFKHLDIPSFYNTEGWNYSIASGDFDNDGDIDLVLGNLGDNNKFNPTNDKPLYIFSGNFDENESYDIALSKTYNGRLVPVRGKECSSEQTPFLNKKIDSYKKFALLDMDEIYGNEIINTAHKKEVYNFSSLYLMNDGDLDFKISKLPSVAQMGPTLDFEIIDINKDGYLDIIGVGNYYDAEVETVRYDASRGYILLGSRTSEFKTLTNSKLSMKADMRVISKVKSIKGNNYLIIINNNDKLNLFKTR